MTEGWEDILGFAMSSYYGGRAECRIRRVPVPVVTVDFRSMYAGVQTLMGMERFLTCSRIDAEEGDPAELISWITSRDADAFFDQANWPELVTICLVQPHQGDFLPIRGRYAALKAAFGIGVNAWGEEPSEAFWYTAPDVVASYLLSGQVPDIRRVFRFVPVGAANGLQTVNLRGEVEVDPKEGRFFAKVVERRALLPQAEQKVGLGRFLKVFASSTSYGVFAEMNRHERSGAAKEPVHITGLRSFDADAVPETPGSFFFAPTAALVTGAARLMLALLEHEVTTRRGVYAFCDTDSMAVVATPRRTRITIVGAGATGLSITQEVRSLSWSDVHRVVAKFDGLNPYDPGVVPHFLVVEEENFEHGRQREISCLAISAKRYALFVTDVGGRPSPISIQDSAEEGEEEFA